MSADHAFIALGGLLPIPVLLGAYLGLLAAGEIVRKQTRLSGEATRKLAHVGSGLVALAIPAVVTAPWQAIVVALVSSAFLAAARRLGRLPSIHEVRRPSLGAELYPLGIAAAFVLAQGDWAHYAVAVLSLAAGDTVAAMVGSKWGTHRFWVWGTARSLEGSAAACATTFAVAVPVLLFAGNGDVGVVLRCICVAIIVAIVEAASPLGTDNLTVPLAAMVVLSAPLALAVAWAALGSSFLVLLILRVSPSRQIAPASVAG